MAYKFAKRRKLDTIPIIRPRQTENDEGLSGFVRGFYASDIEERFARALIKFDLYFWFQYEVATQLSLPNQERRLDFIVFYSKTRTYPVEIYGERWHSTAGDRNRDRARRNEIDEFGKRYDWQPVQVAWGKELLTQGMADAKVRSMFF